MDYSIRPLCFSHVDLPREFFGGVPIHSGEGVSSSPMIYVLRQRAGCGRRGAPPPRRRGLPRRQVDPSVRVLRLGVPGGGPGQGRGAPGTDRERLPDPHALRSRQQRRGVRERRRPRAVGGVPGLAEGAGPPGPLHPAGRGELDHLVVRPRRRPCLRRARPGPAPEVRRRRRRARPRHPRSPVEGRSHLRHPMDLGGDLRRALRRRRRRGDVVLERRGDVAERLHQREHLLDADDLRPDPRVPRRRASTGSSPVTTRWCSIGTRAGRSARTRWPRCTSRAGTPRSVRDFDQDAARAGQAPGTEPGGRNSTSWSADCRTTSAGSERSCSWSNRWASFPVGLTQNRARESASVRL